MAPVYSVGPNLLARTDGISWGASLGELRQQWTQPSDVFSVLLLLGGEIVNRALAQLTGGTITPVTFSFGWASYAITLLLASVGDAKLMPASPDGSCIVVQGKNGYVRDSSSWVIGRILRDYDLWMDSAVRTKLDQMLDERHRYMCRKTKPGTTIPRPSQTGLCISVYEPSKDEEAGKAKHDLVYWGGLLTALIQLAIASIPIATAHDWCVLMITVSGIALALATGSLPQWKEEKWNCRRSSQSTYVLTRGNGSQHAIVIIGNGHGLNLDDLAVAGQLNDPSRDIKTRISISTICLLWILLLVAAAGIRTNTWYLLAVGGIGIVQNVLVAGWRRNPSALGVHLNFREVIGEMETMKSLLALEDKYTDIGRSLLPIFFPGALLSHEVASWEALKVKNTQAQQAQQAQLPNQVRASIQPLESWTAHAKAFEKA